jgi:hypothetical protein
MSMRWARVWALTVVTVGALSQTGCETKAQTGALTGGAIGTAAGALIGGNIGGAAIGGGIGALTGAVVGSSMDSSDRAAANQDGQPVTQFKPLTAKEAEGWILSHQADKLGNLSPYSINASELQKLNSAYANQQFSKDGPKLTTIQLSFLYGVICYFQSQTNPICSEPPQLGCDAS